ncbi:MAG: MarR family transcriptional regulator [Pseudomonadota bacterium]
MHEADTQTIFRFFTEVGIINQLSRALLEARLPSDLTATHFGVIGHLSRRPEGETPLQLATAFQVPKTTMTHMIKVLQRHGLVDVAPNAADGRSKLVVATGAGAAFLGQKIQELQPDIAKAIDEIGVDAFASLLPGLENIRMKLDAARD